MLLCTKSNSKIGNYDRNSKTIKKRKTLFSAAIWKHVAQKTLSEDSIKGYPTSGLLEELSNLQNFTQGYIEKLMNYNRILCNGTFTPTEVDCAQVKVY